jgi:hypothetical protein
MFDADNSTEYGKRALANASQQELTVLRDVGIALSGMRNGEITITVRAGKAVEIERVTRNRPAKRV